MALFITLGLISRSSAKMHNMLSIYQCMLSAVVNIHTCLCYITGNGHIRISVILMCRKRTLIHLTVPWKFVNKIIFWPFEEISIFSNGGHPGYRTTLTDTILRGTHPGTIPARLGLIWFSDFRGEDLNVIFSPLLKIEISSNGQNCTTVQLTAYTDKCWAYYAFSLMIC
jgi:hypothetical protein